MKKKLLSIFVFIFAVVLGLAVLTACDTSDVKYKLNFIVDGEIYATIETSGQETITLPNDPTKEDYEFGGWYYDQDIWSQSFTAYSLVNEILTSNVCVYARWTEKTFTVTYNMMGGGNNTVISVTKGSYLLEPAVSSWDGYIFWGWYKDSTFTTKWDFNSDIVTDDVTLYARWIDGSGCEILIAEGFDFEGSNLSIKVPNAQEYFVLSDVITVTPNASWTVTTDIGGLNEIPSGTVSLNVGDNTFYINVVSANKTKKKQYTVEIRRREIYTVTYIPQNGEPNIIDRYEEDSKIENKTVTKRGYNFTSWLLNDSAWDFDNDTLSGNIILTALWSAKENYVEVELYADEVLCWTGFLDSKVEYSLPYPENWLLPESYWGDENGTQYTNYDGKGIKELSSPFTKLYLYSEYLPVSTATDLEQISMDGKYALINDINLSNKTWTPIGTESNHFTGTFEGNGFTISNISYRSDISYANTGHAGLFGYSEGIIRNLHITGLNINSKSTSKYNYVGGIIAWNEGSVINCTVRGNIIFTTNYGLQGYTYVGGIAGTNRSDGRILDCNVTADITGSDSTSGYNVYSYIYAGGLVGYHYSSGSIQKCFTTGNVTCSARSTGYAGGLVGYHDSSGSIQNCYATGNITCSVTGKGSERVNVHAQAGGLVGLSRGTIQNCYATGNVTSSATFTPAEGTYASGCAESTAGGLVGIGATIQNCYATGNVSSNISSNEAYGSFQFAGGLAGSCSAIQNSYATGWVTLSGLKNADNRAGGLVGNASEDLIVNCYRYEEQSVTGSVDSLKINSIGEEVTIEQIKSVNFYCSTLGWSSDDWNLLEGTWPTLKLDL